MLFARCIFGVYLRALCYAKLVDTRDQKEKKKRKRQMKKKKMPVNREREGVFEQYFLFLLLLCVLFIALRFQRKWDVEEAPYIEFFFF